MLSQKDAVYQATMAVLKQNNKPFEDGQNVREAIGDDLRLRSQIRDLVFRALLDGQVAFGGGNDQRDDRSMRTYATGLVSNWFRKDKRLNGGQRYQPSTSRDTNNQGEIGGYQDSIRRLEAAIEVTNDADLRTRLQDAVKDIKEQADLEERLASDVKAGRYKDDFDEEDENEGPSDEEERAGQEQEAPSMGSGHRGAVTDPEHDMRLKKNETPELQKARQEAGHKGGTSTRDQRGSDFYSQIGQKGGLSRGGRRSDTDEQEAQGEPKENGNIFLRMLKGRAG